VIRSENDANAFAIAETYRSVPKPGEVVVFLLIESGGGIVVGGDLLRGSSGAAGEIEHLKVGLNGFVNPLGRAGDLENYIGREAVLARYRHHAGHADSLADFLNNFARGEAIAAHVAREWGKWLVEVLLLVTTLLNPHVIVLGGPLTPVYECVASDVEAALARRLIEGLTPPVLRSSSLGEYGAAVGGAYIMHQRFLSTDEKMSDVVER